MDRRVATVGLLLALATGCGVNGVATPGPPSTKPVNEGLAFPRSTVGPSAPRFLSGDTAEKDAGPKDWVLVALSQNSEDDKYLVYGYVHKGQDATHWTEFMSYMNTSKPDEKPIAFMTRQEALTEKKCPAVKYTVLKQSDSEIMYESKVAKCTQMADQDEIVRVIYGQINLFRLSYTAHSADMPATQRANAIELLSEFQLKSKE